MPLKLYWKLKFFLQNINEEIKVERKEENIVKTFSGNIQLISLWYVKLEFTSIQKYTGVYKTMFKARKLAIHKSFSLSHLPKTKSKWNDMHGIWFWSICHSMLK